MNGILVIVPCGRRKIWDVDPAHGPAQASDAYIGAPFVVNKQYAEEFAEKWVILSAKYGFIEANFIIPSQYNVTFKQKKTNPVPVSVLRAQAIEQSLINYPTVIGLGGLDYRTILAEAFGGASVALFFPFAGLIVGKAMRAAKTAMRSGHPLPNA